MRKKADTARGAKTRFIIWFAGILVGVIAVGTLWVGWDLWNRRQRIVDCGDGQRYAIDTRNFDSQYLAYSLQLESSVNDKSKISVKLDPVQLEKLSEAMQSANEFRKYVVSGYNSCAISKTQYGQFGSRFQALDSLAREVNELAAKPGRSTKESTKLASLVDEYADLAHKLGTD